MSAEPVEPQVEAADDGGSTLGEVLQVDLSPELVELALTHRSYAYENGQIPTNERLEFLGDSVLGIVVTETLYRAHPDFSIKNPNRLRALFGSFAANQIAFHQPSGAGYRLLADIIIEVDALNPQVAARMVPAFGRWRRFVAPYGEAMRGELERIVATPGLSKDVFEQASKSLG